MRVVHFTISTGWSKGVHATASRPLDLRYSKLHFIPEFVHSFKWKIINNPFSWSDTKNQISSTVIMTPCQADEYRSKTRITMCSLHYRQQSARRAARPKERADRCSASHQFESTRVRSPGWSEHVSNLGLARSTLINIFIVEQHFKLIQNIFKGGCCRLIAKITRSPI